MSDQTPEGANSPQPYNKEPVEVDERTKPFISEVEAARSDVEPLEPISWTASEYVAHQKSLGWFLVLGAGAVVLAVFIYYVTGGDIVSAVSVLILAIVFGVYARRPPREQQYLLDELGVHIGKKTYRFETLRSFSILDEGAFSTIVFMPLGRFMPLVSIYFDPQDEEKVVAFLSEYLPIEYRKHDAIDRFMHKIRF